MSNKKKTQAELDWETRTLCLDESCIGVIGPDGRCKECGKPFEGFEYQTVDTVGTKPPPESDPEVEELAPSASEPDTDWENRTLCLDESCIGVIGPDGRCKECGLAYEKND
jgi:hypothetical protein